MDIDSIQAHGLFQVLTINASRRHNVTHNLGIGAADITKLKANGFYTVAVSSQLVPMVSFLL